MFLRADGQSTSLMAQTLPHNVRCPPQMRHTVEAAFDSFADTEASTRYRLGMTGEVPNAIPSRAGCAWSMLGINALIIGLAAVSFSQGPYSSWEQEVWYRYCSMGLLLCGAILPAIALLLGARKSALATALLTTWMLAAFVAFLIYAMFSGGGV